MDPLSSFGWFVSSQSSSDNAAWHWSAARVPPLSAHVTFPQKARAQEGPLTQRPYVRSARTPRAFHDARYKHDAIIVIDLHLSTLYLL